MVPAPQGSAPLMPSLAIRLNPTDNVVVARADLLPGTKLDDYGVTCRTHVPAGHKMAIAPVAPGEPVRRYGQIIGFATVAIEPGQHVHTQNIAMGDFARDYAFCADYQPTDYIPEHQRATIQGIVRDDGRVATRNFIGILTSVNCSATAAK